MKRSEIRENILKLLYLDDFHDKEELNTQFSLYFDGKNDFTEDDKSYIIEKANKILDSKESIDKEIETVSNKWKVDRMDKVDKAILRLAYYEIKMDDEIPDKVAVNEAVELSKKYSSDASPKFINGILSNFVSE
ncbi:MAG: transcription antitermination factor NusB [Eubacterium sp.]|nr:transcription antitermination factor NusB [Eubacterium sp.]